MAALPGDVVGVISDFAVASAAEAVTYGRVSSTWMAAVVEQESLWLRLMRIHWPDTKPKHGRFTVYRARMLAVRGVTPIAAADTHPIERCNFEFRCPYILEALTLVPDASVAGGVSHGSNDKNNPVYFCDVCKEHVFTVRTQGELDQRAAEGRCVVFKAPRSLTSDWSVALVDSDNVSAWRALCAIRAHCGTAGIETSGAVGGPAAAAATELCTQDRLVFRAFTVAADAPDAPEQLRRVSGGANRVIFCGDACRGLEATASTSLHSSTQSARFRVAKDTFEECRRARILGQIDFSDIGGILAPMVDLEPERSALTAARKKKCVVS